jgi:hypothetical protein
MGSHLAAFIAGLAVALAIAGAVTSEDGGRPLSTALTPVASGAPDQCDPNATGEAKPRLDQGRRQIGIDVSRAAVAGLVRWPERRQRLRSGCAGAPPKPISLQSMASRRRRP